VSDTGSRDETTKDLPAKTTRCGGLSEPCEERYSIDNLSISRIRFYCRRGPAAVLV